jgi:hypothetical protein
MGNRRRKLIEKEITKHYHGMFMERKQQQTQPNQNRRL